MKTRRTLARATCALIFSACLCLLRAAGAPTATDKITVIFRFDDYSALSDTGLETKLFAVFQDHRIPLTVAAIPFACKNPHDPTRQELSPLTLEKIKLLQDALKTGTFELALHGYAHQTRAPKSPGDYSEFQGEPFDTQFSKISKGKAFFEQNFGTHITTFVPPWNNYDSNTLAALEKLNFRTVSASEGQPIVAPTSLRFIPETCHADELRSAVRAARSFPNAQRIVLVIIHAFDFRDADPQNGRFSLNQLRDLLSWGVAQPDLHFMTVDAASSELSDLSQDRLSSNAPRFFDVVAPPPPLRPSVLDSVFVYLDPVHAGAAIAKRRNAVMFFYLALFGISILIAFAAGRIVFRHGHFFSIVILGLTMLGILALVYMRRHHFLVSYREVSVIAVLVAMSVGSLLAYKAAKTNQ